MKKRLSLFLSFATAFVFGVSHAEPAPRAAGMVWRINGGAAPLYIAGSIHFLPRSAYPLPVAYETAYQAAERLVLELDLGEAGQPSTTAMMLRRGLLDKGVSLRDILSQEAWDKAERICASLGISINSFKTMKPWLFSLTIAVHALEKRGFDPEQGVDRHFYRRAVADGKPVSGLETAECQVNIFERISRPDAWIEMLYREVAVMDRVLSDLLDAWQRGDVEALALLLDANLKDAPEVAEILLNERNENWSKLIQTLLTQSQPTMVIVGAGHLVGEGNLLDLLSAKGFEIERLR